MLDQESIMYLTKVRQKKILFVKKKLKKSIVISDRKL